MAEFVLKIYDYLKKHKFLCFFSAVVITMALVFQISGLNYKEDISDFLPLNSNHQNAFKVYQNISGANKIFVIFKCKDTLNNNPDSIVKSIDDFVGQIQENDTLGIASSLTYSVDYEDISSVSSFVYNNIPYFLSESYYKRIDSLFADEQFIQKQLEQDKQMLMFPVGGLLKDNLQIDPLNLFTPVVSLLQNNSTDIKYELYDGYIFSSNMSRAIVMLNSPFGSSETENNAKLMKQLQEWSDKVCLNNQDVKINFVGGPCIAVSNAQRIKTDSIISVVLSAVLILLLLVYSIRNLFNIFLILFSIAWGWLFALGALTFINSNVSVIVIGISSVIIGIAVNYPLHFVAHLSHTPNIKTALKEIVMPLLVGNITTVAAFLTLVPLESVALRDLGLFSSFLLVGTILFVLLFLPHMVKISRKYSSGHYTLLNKIGEVSLENKPYIVWTVCALTVVLFFFSFRTRFDPNIGNINYMTSQQREDMNYFQSMLFSSSSNETLYVVSQASSIDSALNSSLRFKDYLNKVKASNKIQSVQSCSQFIVSQDQMQKRLVLWNNFIEKYRLYIMQQMPSCCAKAGFAEDSFNDFYQILNKEYGLKDLSYFNPLISKVFASNFSIDSLNNQYSVIDVLKVDKLLLNDVREEIQKENPKQYAFDLISMNTAIADNMSNDFNYIGWVCGFIVFFFLWFSLNSIELALMSFLPMAISWIWILGIMGLFNMQFNIVNVILATFIFGQGDDYTIFMTEGACYEYAYGKKMLSSYKHSIIISALIMFIGIGTLIVAKHPALFALAQVTIVGMFSVVLMAYLFPPLIFKFMVSKNGSYRQRPLSLCCLFTTFIAWANIKLHLVIANICLCFIGKNASADKYSRLLHCLCKSAARCFVNIKIMAQDVAQSNNFAADYAAQSNNFAADYVAQSNNFASAHAAAGQRLLVVNDYSPLAIIAVVANFKNAVFFNDGNFAGFKGLFKCFNHLFVKTDNYSNSSLTKVFVHGVNDVLPEGNVLWGLLYPGKITAILNYEDSEVLEDVIRGIENVYYYKNFVLDCYRYKGVEIEGSVKRNLKKYHCYSKYLSNVSDKFNNIVIINPKFGEFAILCALVNKNSKVFVYEQDSDNILVAKTSCKKISNIEFVTRENINGINASVCYKFTDGESVEVNSKVVEIA